MAIKTESVRWAVVPTGDTDPDCSARVELQEDGGVRISETPVGTHVRLQPDEVESFLEIMIALQQEVARRD